MKFPSLFLVSLLLIFSCQKEPDVNLDPEPPVAGKDSLTITYFSPDSVIAGMTIRIGGTGFDSTLSGNVVTLNGAAITLVTVSDTLITALIPETASTGKVSITVNGKTVTSLTDLVVSQKPPDVSEKDIWVRKGDFPGPRVPDGPEHAHSFSLGGKGYYLLREGLWMYSPGNDSWNKKPTPLPAGVNTYGFCFTIGDKVYVGLGAVAPGDDISGNKEVWEYTVTTDSWERKKDFPGTPRVVPFSFSIGNTGYIGGGDTLNVGSTENIIYDVWKYDPNADLWTKQSDFPGPRGVGLSGLSINNAGYVVELGSNDPTSPLSDHKDIHVWKYDPANDTWQEREKLPTQYIYNGGGTAFVIDQKIYLAAGAYDSVEVNGEFVMQNFWMYDPVANTWTEKKDIGDGGVRLFSYGFAIDGKGYLGLGTGATADEVKKDFWEYNP